MRRNRLSRIENYIMQQGNVSLEDLAEKFQLSVSTARRDVIALAEQGTIIRTRGGATSKVLPKSPADILNRQQKNTEAKQLIGELSARLVQDGQSLYIDAGSTTRYIVPHLAQKQDITIITSSVNIITEAVKLPNVHLIVLGGEYSATSDSLHSYASIDELLRFNIDITFLGTTGISVSGGLTTATFMESTYKQTALKCAKETVVLADSSKFGMSSISKFAEIKEVSTIVSDIPLPDDIQQYCRLYNIGTISPGDVISL